VKRLFNLKTRGIILVILPLLCQFIFVGILIANLSNLQDELIRATHSRRLLTKAHTVCVDVLTYTTKTFFDGMPGHNPVDQAKIRSEVDRLKKPFDTLVNMTRNTPGQAKNADSLETSASNFLRIIDEMFTIQGKGEDEWMKVHLEYDKKWEDATLDFVDQLGKIMRTESAKRASEKYVEEFKQNIHHVVLAAFLLSIFVSSGLAIGVWIFFRQPIMHIAENVRRMSERRQLLPALNNNDELGELDQYIHTAAAGIEQAFAREQLMVEETVDMICIMSADGRLRRVNPATTKLTGWKAEELLLQTVFDLVYSEDVARADEEFYRAKETGSRSCFDVRLRCKDGQLRETRWSCVYSTADQEMFAVIHDVTDEKNVERLKQDFLDMITHDLRSPLTSMHGSLMLLTEGVRGELSSDVRQEVSGALNSIEHLTSLVNDLLDFQKLAAGKMTMLMGEHDVDAIVQDSINMLRESAQAKGINLTYKSRVKTVYCDRTKLVQVLNNLVSNAIKFSPENSEVQITVQTIKEDSGEFVEVHILDTGSGIPEQLAEKIFEAFERLPGERKEGTGLGLAICKMIVEAHDGSIGVNCASTGGDFWFKMPLRPRVSIGS